MPTSQLVPICNSSQTTTAWVTFILIGTTFEKQVERMGRRLFQKTVQKWASTITQGERPRSFETDGASGVFQKTFRQVSVTIIPSDRRRSFETIGDAVWTGLFQKTVKKWASTITRHERPRSFETLGKHPSPSASKVYLACSWDYSFQTITYKPLTYLYIHSSQ